MYFKKILSDELKIAEVAQIFKKNDPDGKTNYRPITLLQLFYSKRDFTNKLKSCRKDPIAQTFKRLSNSKCTFKVIK